MGEALEMLLMGSSKQPESVPLPKIDENESSAKQQYAKAMHELRAALEATKADDNSTWDSLLQKHRATGGVLKLLLEQNFFFLFLFLSRL